MPERNFVGEIEALASDPSSPLFGATAATPSLPGTGGSTTPPPPPVDPGPGTEPSLVAVLATVNEALSSGRM